MSHSPCSQNNCGALKNPHAVRKELGTAFPGRGLVGTGPQRLANAVAVSGEYSMLCMLN